MNFTPKTAMQAARLIRVEAASRTLDAVVFWNGDNTCTLDSFKVNEEGKKVRSRYEVDLNKETCTCPNFADYGDYCKHILYADRIATDSTADADREAAAEAIFAQMDFDAETAELYPY